MRQSDGGCTVTGTLDPPGPGWALQHGGGAALRSPSTGGGHGVGCEQWEEIA